MAPSTPTGVPSEIVAGDSVRFRVADFSDYPQSEGWSLAYRLVGHQAITITPTWQSSGDDVNHWLVSEATTVMAGVEPGDYRLIGRMTGSGSYSGRLETVSDDPVTIKRNPATAQAGDYVSFNVTLLAECEKKIAEMVASGLQSYQVAGRTVNRPEFEKQLALRAALQAAVNQERSGTFGQDIQFVAKRVA